MASEYVIVAWKLYGALACVLSLGVIIGGLAVWPLAFSRGYRFRDKNYWL